MNQGYQTSKSSVLLIIAGIGVGALSTATILSKNISAPAMASGQAENAKMRTIGQPSTESMAELRNLDNSYANLAEFVSPAVVDIQATSGRQTDATGARVPSRGSEGSGFIFRQDGYIITNDHVVGNSDSVKVILKDGREYTGKVTRAEDSDLALVKINASNLPVLAFGDSAKVRPGQQVMAAGAPFGMQQSVTFGHVSAVKRISSASDGMSDRRLYADLIQTDTSINMGNSGGPLVDIDGRVVGVNTLIYSPSGVSAGIGFAIPSNQVKFISDLLVSKGKITRSMLGLIPSNLKEYQLKDMKIDGGALVDDVQPNSSAAEGGIQKGDVIVKIGSAEIRNQLDLRNAMLVNEPGKSLPVELIRSGARKTVTVKLKEYVKPKEEAVVPRNSDSFRLGPDFFKDFPELTKPKSDSKSTSPRSGKVKLGVGILDVTDEMRKQFNIPSGVVGAVVGTVEPGSVAEDTGLQPGDVVTYFGSKSIKSAKDLTDAIGGLKWGDSGRIRFSRYADGGVITQERDVIFK